MHKKRYKKIIFRFLPIFWLIFGFGVGYIAKQNVKAPTTLTAPIPLAYQDTVDPYFSPNGGCTDAIVSSIEKAKKKKYVHAYSFTSKPIANALIKAFNRGVEVRVLADGLQASSRYSQLPRLRKKRYKKIIFRFLPVFWLIFGFGVGYIAKQDIKAPLSAEIPFTDQDTVDAYFSPNGGCTDAIVSSIEKAKKEIYVHTYSFTSKPIANALIKAFNRGIEVRVLADGLKASSKYSQLPRLREHGIMIWIDKVSGVAHNKVMLIDNEHLITGSFNWSAAAEYKNAENLLILNKANLVEVYKENWHKRMKKATLYS